MGISGPGGIDPKQFVGQQLPIPASVGPGSPAKDVQGVQSSLKELGYKIEAKEDKADTYGPSTQAAVRQFQKDRHLPETGVADGQTQLAMASALREKQQSERERIALQNQIQKSSFGL